MYQVDGRDVVAKLAEVPQCDVGAPCPAVIAAEHSLTLLYLISDPDPTWDGTTVTVVGPGTTKERVARVRFFAPYAHFFGPPNDEAFSGHPLASRGLSAYAAFEIRESSWIRILERMNSVHPYHSADHFAKYKHFIFAFHDTTFECVAEGFSIDVAQGSISEVAAAAPTDWV